MTKGLRIDRRFTNKGEDPYDQIDWSRRDSRITNPDGSTVFEMAGAEIPAAWSQVAADIMVSKYFRKAGVPQFDDNGEQILDESGQPPTHRNGSTPASTMPMASPAPLRASGMSTAKTKSSKPPPTPTAAPPLMPASSSPSATTW
jgi:hypothetical protein